MIQYRRIAGYCTVIVIWFFVLVAQACFSCNFVFLLQEEMSILRLLIVKLLFLNFHLFLLIIYIIWGYYLLRVLYILLKHQIEEEPYLIHLRIKLRLFHFLLLIFHISLKHLIFFILILKVPLLKIDFIINKI